MSENRHFFKKKGDSGQSPEHRMGPLRGSVPISLSKEELADLLMYWKALAKAEEARSEILREKCEELRRINYDLTARLRGHDVFKKSKE